jgi:hypothetical protein
MNARLRVGRKSIGAINLADRERSPGFAPLGTGVIEIEFAGGTSVRVNGIVASNTLAAIVAASVDRPA